MKAQKLDWNTKNFSSSTGFHRRRRWYFQMFGNLFQIEKVKVALCTRVIVWRYIIQEKCWKHTLAVWGTIGESIYRFQLNRFNFSFFPFICCCYCTKFYSAFNTIFYVHYELAEAAKKAHKFQSFSLSFLSFFSSSCLPFGSWIFNGRRCKPFLSPSPPSSIIIITAII